MKTNMVNTMTPEQRTADYKSNYVHSVYGAMQAEMIRQSLLPAKPPLNPEPCEADCLFCREERELARESEEKSQDGGNPPQAGPLGESL